MKHPYAKYHEPWLKGKTFRLRQAVSQSQTRICCGGHVFVWSKRIQIYLDIFQNIITVRFGSNRPGDDRNFESIQGTDIAKVRDIWHMGASFVIYYHEPPMTLTCLQSRIVQIYTITWVSIICFQYCYPWRTHIWTFWMTSIIRK
jgi:hypothetical protein